MKLLRNFIVVAVILILYASISFAWNYDFKDQEEVTLVDGKTYIDTTGTGHLTLSAPPGNPQYGEQVLFPDEDAGAVFDNAVSDGYMIALDSLEVFIEDFQTTNYYDSEASQDVYWDTNNRHVRLDKDLEWYQQDSGVEDIRLNDLEFINESQGWSVGGYGATSSIVLRTLDGGANWDSIPSIVDKELTSIHFKNNFGVVTGIEGIIIIVEGPVWEEVNSGVTWNLWDAEIFDDGDGLPTILAVGDNGTLLKSEDGGDSWEDKSITEDNLYSIDKDQNGIFWIVGANGTLLKSQDNGETWEHGSIDTPYNLYDIDFTNNIGWICGDGGALLRSTNSGISWQPVESGTNKNLRDVNFPSEQYGWVVGESGALLMSAQFGDSGTWIEQAGSFHDLYEISFVDNDIGWVSGDDGTILKTPRYVQEGAVVSARIADIPNVISGAYIRVRQENQEDIHNITYYLSNNDGNDWVEFPVTHQEGDYYISDYQSLNVLDSNLKWKAVMESEDTDTTPKIKRVEVYYNKGYESPGYYYSPVLDFDLPAQMKRFTTIDWTPITPAGTSIEVSYKIDDDINYTSAGNSGSYAINRNGKRIQYRVKLQSPSSDYTPVLEDLTINYGYVAQGKAISDHLVVPEISAWREVLLDIDEASYNPDDGHSVMLEILNRDGQAINFGETIEMTPDNGTFDISGLDPGESQFRNLALRVMLKSDNPNTSPAINSWEITYIAGSVTEFVDANGNSVNSYELGDLIYVQTEDGDENDFGTIDSVWVKVFDSTRKDTVNLRLVETTPTSGIFRGSCYSSGNDVDTKDQVLQTAEKNEIVARYVDPNDPNDVSQDQAVIGEGSGNIYEGVPSFRSPDFSVVVSEYDANSPVYVQVEDDTDCMTDSVLDVELYKKDAPDNKLSVQLPFYDYVPGSEIRAYFRKELGQQDIEGPLSLSNNQSETLVLSYEDCNDGDANPLNDVKTTEVLLKEIIEKPGVIDSFYVYPNPWEEGDGGPWFYIELTSLGEIDLYIYNIAADEVKHWNRRGRTFEKFPDVNGWNLENSHGNDVASGTYICVLKARATGLEETEAIKLVIIR